LYFDEIDLNLAKQRQKKDENRIQRTEVLLMRASDYPEPDALKLFQESKFAPDYNEMILEARKFFNLSPSAKTETGRLFIPGAKKPIPLKSGYEGGPWAGTQRGGVPRGRGSAFSSGAPSEANIATHVEGHGIQKMWEVGAKKAVIVVGSEPCGICSRDIPAALPKGAQLLVIHPDAVNPRTWTRTWFGSSQ
jgi:SCP1.201-like deaminase